MEMTRYKRLSQADQFRGMPAPPLEEPAPKEGKFISLPPPSRISAPPMEMRSAIESRRSVRRYSGQSLTMDELAYLLWCTQGIKESHEPYATFRTVPSAGGRHAFETYLQINRVSDLQPGLYRYLAFSHRLLLIDPDPGMAECLADACLRQAMVKDSAVFFIWSCAIYRMAWRYSERAYRLVHLDAGHVCQNLYLAAGAYPVRLQAMVDAGTVDQAALDAVGAMPEDLVQFTAEQTEAAAALLAEQWAAAIS